MASWVSWMLQLWVRGLGERPADATCSRMPLSRLGLPHSSRGQRKLLRKPSLNCAGSEAGLQLDLNNVLVIGRKDYVLRSVHPQASCSLYALIAGCWRSDSSVFLSFLHCPALPDSLACSGT